MFFLNLVTGIRFIFILLQPELLMLFYAWLVPCVKKSAMVFYLPRLTKKFESQEAFKYQRLPVLALHALLIQDSWVRQAEKDIRDSFMIMDEKP